MTQNAATMAMNISVVWTMGSGMPIVATAGRRSGGGHQAKGAGGGDAAAGCRGGRSGRSNARSCSCS